MNNTEKTAAIILLAAKRSALKKAVFSKPCDKSTVRAVATLKSIKGQSVIQLESFLADNKAVHQNITVDGGEAALAEVISAFRQVNVITVAGECEYRRSVSGNDTLLGGDKLASALETCEQRISAGGNDKKKNYILEGNDNFLFYSVSATKTADLTIKSSRSFARSIASSNTFAIPKSTSRPRAICTSATSAAERAIFPLPFTIISPQSEAVESL